GAAAQPELGARLVGASEHDRAAARRGELGEAGLGAARLDVAGDARHRDAERVEHALRGLAGRGGAPGRGEREQGEGRGDGCADLHGFTSMAATLTVCLGLNMRYGRTCFSSAAVPSPRITTTSPRASVNVERRVPK